MQIDNQIASHRWRSRHANSNHFPDGTRVASAPDLIIQSKWGGNEVHEHPVWEIPLEHGDQVRFFKRPKSEWILDRLEAALSVS